MFEFKELGYAYNALEPYIDAQTMEIHHSKHHKTYYDKFLASVAGTPMENLNIEGVIEQVDENTSPAIRNNAGGYFNHNLFWNCIAPNGTKEPKGNLADAINTTFGSYEKLKTAMNDAGVARFGSGFVWLIVKDNQLQVISTPNQDNPLMKVSSTRGTPIMAIDVWEHAYYLKYQNRRPDYLEAIWNVVNWSIASELFSKID